MIQAGAGSDLRRRVWILSFEYAGVTSVAGLGVAVRAYATACSSRGDDVTVYVPASSFRSGSSSRKAHRLGDFEYSGVRVGVDGVERPFSVGAVSMVDGGVRIILFTGEDEYTRSVLESTPVYANVDDKASIYARSFSAWVERFPSAPDVLHTNDWHTVVAGLNAKIMFERRRIYVPWVHTVHLLASPEFAWHYGSQDWSGLPDVEHRVWRVYAHRRESTRSVWESCSGNLDRLAVVECDQAFTVSRGYREQVVMLAGGWTRQKVGVVYHCTDWKVRQVEEWVRAAFGADERRLIRADIPRILDRMGVTSPGYRFRRKLALSSGRLTWQKGFDDLVRSSPYLGEDVSVIVVGVPVGDTAYERYLDELAAPVADRFLITRSRLDARTLGAMVYASNVFVVPSRYEPFGLTAAESQAVGTPVVAADVPGLNEVVDPVSGRLVPPGDCAALGKAISEVASATAAEDERGEGKTRVSSIAWIDHNFREEQMFLMLSDMYTLASRMAYYRSVA